MRCGLLALRTKYSDGAEPHSVRIYPALYLVEAIVPSEVGVKCDVASGAAPVQHVRRALDVKERSGDSLRCGPEGVPLEAAPSPPPPQRYTRLTHLPRRGNATMTNARGSQEARS